MAGTVVAPSPIAGSGLFAAVPLPAGTPIADHVRANHSCEPNLGWSGAELVTVRDVPAGEELTYDYSTAISDPSFLLRCHCPSWRCRQMVTGDDWRIPQLQERYAGHWSGAVARLIAAGQ